MITFVKPISYIALESLEVGHFRPGRRKKRQKCAFCDFERHFLKNLSDKFV